MKKKICLLIFIQARDRKWNAKTTINIKLVFFYFIGDVYNTTMRFSSGRIYNSFWCYIPQNREKKNNNEPLAMNRV